MKNPNAKYGIKTEQYDVSYDDYMNFEKTFGEFGKDGKSYTVTDRNTPRQWLNFMVNDRFASVAGNDGSGFTALNSFYLRITKYHSFTDYLLRTLNGRRVIKLIDKVSGEEYDLLKDTQNMKFTVKTGSSLYEGEIGGIKFSVELFVPNNDTCECWIIKLTGDNKKYRLSVSEDLAFMNHNIGEKASDGDMNMTAHNGYIIANSEKAMPNQTIYAVFGMEGSFPTTEKYSEFGINNKIYDYTTVTLSKEVALGNEEQIFLVVSGAGADKEETEALYQKYMSLENVCMEKEAVEQKWERIIESNKCELPDKNLQHFLNVWLKNQVYLTMRYNRFNLIGYRDIMQDTWGHLLVEPESIRPFVLGALSKMYPDGRCPRQYDHYTDELDRRDFMDSPLWIPITVCDYIKETGDFSILNEEIGYYDSDKKDTVADHMLLSLDYLYNSRGKNGLILMRRGDWLDGLNGIDQYGEATTVWGTMAAFHVQNMLAEMYHELGETETEKKLLSRSAEYKEIVNSVAWDGNWYVYAFIDDEPIGSSKCHEGKIYLNTQSWAIMTGIYDDEKKVEKMYRAIGTYLMTPYGPQLNAPAYQKYGEKCGRLQTQRPGTFANGGIYLHATSFMVMAHCAYGKYDDALDLMQRILPNHPDNCDTRRTSEPYSVGNVYYGSEHSCHGENLYSWFSATPSWLIHDGFEGLLGVKADYKGLKITPHEIDDWQEYFVKKTFRGTTYRITFRKSTEKGIYVDGIKSDSNSISSTNKECNVTVLF
ncbi:MAG: hypothetical protein E7670_05480 [Ruminococcaceae bacterium]|nr:hypothetical protein [Oscillospiraceae bacterium]